MNHVQQHEERLVRQAKREQHLHSTVRKIANEEMKGEMKDRSILPTGFCSITSTTMSLRLTSFYGWIRHLVAAKKQIKQFFGKCGLARKRPENIRDNNETQDPGQGEGGTQRLLDPCTNGPIQPTKQLNSIDR